RRERRGLPARSARKSASVPHTVPTTCHAIGVLASRGTRSAPTAVSFADRSIRTCRHPLVWSSSLVAVVFRRRSCVERPHHRWRGFDASRLVQPYRRQNTTSFAVGLWTVSFL